MCLRSTMGDPGFLLKRDLGAARCQRGRPGLVLRLHLHLKVTLNFHRVQSYSFGPKLCSSHAPGPEVAGQLPA